MQYIKWFKELGAEDVDLVGGKGASLGEMYQNLSKKGIRIPNGFAITSSAYKMILDINGAWEKLHELLDKLDMDDIHQLQIRSKKCRKIITECMLPDELIDQIAQGYDQLKNEYGKDITLAVRSSATAEDSPEASFAGQNETYLNISSLEALLDAYKHCLASNFTDRSIHYKHDHGFDTMKVYLSVVVMKMVRSDIGTSGVMFSIDTESGFDDVVFINASYGMGETIVQGSVEPDSFYAHKPALKKGYRSVLKRRLGQKAIKMIFSDNGNKNKAVKEYTKVVNTPLADQKRFCISDDEAIELAQYSISIEEHYSKKAGHNKPMDIEWAKDGIDGHLYVVQARPETVESRKSETIFEMYTLKEESKILAKGYAIGSKIGSGKVQKIIDASNLHEFKEGNILVAATTSPDWEPIMKIASAIITDSGGRTCHAAIISRELGIPAIVGTKNATTVLRDGQEVTVSCSGGEVGIVYEGILQYEIKHIDLGTIPKTKTKIMMNLGNPDLAFSLASLPVDGIGLARMEFIISNSIKVHPMALIYPEKTDEQTIKEIEKLTQAYENNETFFIKTLSEGVASIASAVYPKSCVVRMSDFKTNEYASLLGGKFFEPEEANPMLGFRGASRYTHPNYQDGFALECKAMKRVREEMGFDNVILMIPFCRRVKEAKKVVDAMETYGLKRGENGLQIYVMCEIPNNVIEIDSFSEFFDGFSIGSNDLTQLMLGVDRDSEIVAFDYDERDLGVMKMINMAVQGAKRNNRHSGICGQGPSDYPEMAEALVKMKIDSISLNPDSVLETIQIVSKIESKLKEPLASK
ncbi:MAG: phosphoenolpyruvate synthase [Campylobacterales bacterium]|nr:phosphoenolpyruvate synthase [Campylobacterales bacterium]